MALSNKALEVVTRPLPREQVKQRPGKGGMTFNYISADLVIELLNEAFDRSWSTKILSSEVHDNTVVIGLELSVPDENGHPVVKQQFGSCDVGRGMGFGEAFKGAASDALKKAATLLGLGLELYHDEEVAAPAPRLPQAKPPQGRLAAPQKAAPAPPSPPRAPSAPKGGNPFANGNGNGNGSTASVPAPKPAAPPAPRNVPAPAASRANPFASGASNDSGPNSTQMNAMVNLAAKKNLSQEQMIALADITDAHGSPVQTFEELTRPQAIEVIKAAQR